MNFLRKTIKCALFLFSLFFLFSCEQNKNLQNHRYDNKIVIWTNCSEFAQYIEVFNNLNKENSAILVYKENPALSLPPLKDELPPDIIISPWLTSENYSKNFKKIDYLFDNKILSSNIFYPQLLEVGKKRKTQYLLPVSFNLPTIIFSNENKDFILQDYSLTLNEIKEIATKYNNKNKNGIFTKIGFTPLSNPDFLYLTAKLNNADFFNQENKIYWNQQNLDSSINYLKNWIISANESPSIEEDFSYKYLYMPYYRQISSNRTLFSYTTSEELFKTMKEQNLNIDFRWISQNEQIPIEDDYMMMAIHKSANNLVGATQFISWFYDLQNQKSLLVKKDKQNLGTQSFGIAGGFSAVRDVTTYILPLFYPQLMTNLPPAKMITVPKPLPSRWESFKIFVVEKYIKSSITMEKNSPSIQSLQQEWQKRMYY